MQSCELEICVETLQACQAAAEGGADRIELCAALGEGGVTPSRAFLKAALASSPLPVHVLLRPRSGDFIYSAAEFDVLCGDLEDALAAGASGVVAGVLTSSHEIDHPRTADLIRRSNGLPVTFHRAFDRTRNLSESLATLLDLGCSRVLTSGGEPTVMQGLFTLERLARQAEGRMRVAAGGGVTLANAPQLTRIAGIDLHASLLPKSSGAPPSDPLWDGDTARRILSAEAVRQLSAIVHPDGKTGAPGTANPDTAS